MKEQTRHVVQVKQSAKSVAEAAGTSEPTQAQRCASQLSAASGMTKPTILLVVVGLQLLTGSRFCKAARPSSSTGQTVVAAGRATWPPRSATTDTSPHDRNRRPPGANRRSRCRAQGS
jgi:hypothetical protein